MIKIRLFEPDIHRNETTFRPYWFIKEQLRQVGVDLILDGDSYDIMLVGQASIADKKRPLQESVEMGLKKLDKITGDYIILDGQDSTSLIGTIDVFRHVHKNQNCKLFLKTSYLKDFDLYKKGWQLGRMYWGPGEYSVPDIDEMKPKMKLAGMNWLSTMQASWNFPPKLSRTTDLWAFFQYPMGKEVYEHGLLQSVHYDNFRKGLIDKLDYLESRFRICRMRDGQRRSHEEYYKDMYDSKIIVAAFGYGEMAPRDIESSIFDAILFKNDMSHIDTIPNPYIPFETYVPIKWNWSDVNEKVEMMFDTSKLLKSEYRNLPKNMRQKYLEENDPVKRTLHVYNLLKELDSIGVDDE